jgi:hypothetical protein
MHRWDKLKIMAYMQPIKQAGLVFAGALLLMFLGWLSTVSNIFQTDNLYPWSIATAFTLLFALLNSLMSLTADNFVKYWGSSMYSYMALAFANGLAAWGFSGVSLGDAESFRWIYFVITVGFLVFLSLVNLMKKIVQFAEREEWNQPKHRK